jgi:Phycobilisome protein
VLVSSEFVKTPAVERLLKIWEQRYNPDLSSLSLVKDASSYSSLLQAASAEGRALTAAKLKDQVLDINSQMAWIQTKSLYAYLNNILDLNEARRITEFGFLVYKKILEIYQEQCLTGITGDFEGDSISEWGIPAINELANALEPILLLFQQQHIAAKDWRSLGFMTTELNFNNQLILHKLTPIEKVLLNPYLKFVEEHIAIPWQRVCAAAAKHQSGSMALTIVEQMLPVTEEIAHIIYHRLVQFFPNHHSRRGGLSDPGVKHSCLRDLNMFQAYLWLCVLQQSMAPVEGELVDLCVMVMESVQVKWELTQQWCQVLMAEVEMRLQEEQRAFLQPYLQGMQQAFFNQRSRLGFVG